MATGKVKKLNMERGFGFIRADNGQEFFFHRSGVRGRFEDLTEQDRVSFDEEPSDKGPRAANVQSV